MEIAKRAIAAFNRLDLDGLAELLTPECEWYPAMLLEVEGAGFRGRAGLNAYLEATSDTWEEFRIVADEFRSVGEEQVLVLGRIEGRGRASGVQVARPWAVIYSFGDGKISRVRAFLDHGEALRAAGLSE